VRDTFIARLLERAEADCNIHLVTGDLGFGVLNEYRERVPQQFINAGVSEQLMTGLAAGMALEGMTVCTYSIANFCTLRCLEQIRNDAAYHDANVKVISVGGGFSYGALGMSHHATEDLAILRAIPGITVVAPGDNDEVIAATDAILDQPGTCFLRLDKSMAAPSFAAKPFELGKARCIRKGGDVTIVATGGILGEAQHAAKKLSEHGVEASVLSVHTIKPFDVDAIIDAATNTGGIVTVEEHVLQGGLGSCVAESLMDEGFMPKFFKRLGMKGEFTSVVGSQAFLRSYYGLDATSIASAVLSGLGSK